MQQKKKEKNNSEWQQIRLHLGVLNDKNRCSYYLRFLFNLYVCDWWVCMNEEDKIRLDKIVDKLEKRIASLEKVLASHAKCIGELRKENNE